MKKVFFTIIFLVIYFTVPNVKADGTTLYCEYFDEYGAAYTLTVDFTSRNIDSFDYEFRKVLSNEEAYTELSPHSVSNFLKYGMLDELGTMACPVLLEKTNASGGVSLVLWSDNSDTTATYKELETYKQECPASGCNILNAVSLSASELAEMFTSMFEEDTAPPKDPVGMAPDTEGGHILSGGEADTDIMCKGEFGAFLKQLFALIKFAVPVLVLGLSVADYVKAMLNQSQEEIKKASSRLVKRLIIGAVIFVLPTLIDYILKLAGINSNTCGW